MHSSRSHRRLNKELGRKEVCGGAIDRMVGRKLRCAMKAATQDGRQGLYLVQPNHNAETWVKVLVVSLLCTPGEPPLYLS